MNRNIKLLVMDVDGTLTDGKIYIGEEGEVMKAFDVKDGCGIKDILPQYGIKPVVITARKSKIVDMRCRELDIDRLYQGVRDKISKLDEIVETLFPFCSYNNIAYIGDDILDLGCMNRIKQGGGIVGCPADAAHSVMEIADFICTRKGGDGAVREFVEWITQKS